MFVKLGAHLLQLLELGDQGHLLPQHWLQTGHQGAVPVVHQLAGRDSACPPAPLLDKNPAHRSLLHLVQAPHRLGHLGQPLLHLGVKLLLLATLLTLLLYQPGLGARGLSRRAGSTCAGCQSSSSAPASASCTPCCAPCRG